MGQPSTRCKIRVLVDERLKHYADALYADARMESISILQKARVQSARDRAVRNPSNLPLSGPDVQAVVCVFGDHIERCIAARLDSYEKAYTHAGQTPSDQDFTDILEACKAVRVLDIRHSTQAIKEFIGSRGAAGAAGLNVEGSVQSGSAHGHDRVLQKWKIWRAKTQVKPSMTTIAEPEKQKDALLGIYNKDEFDKDLMRLLSRSATTSPLALVVMDLDKFKSINDGPGGHEAGNRALKVFAEAVRCACEGKGCAYRWGGDELCLLLPNHSVAESVAVAERVVRDVRGIRTDELRDGLSTSIGVACFPESTSEPSHLFADADHAMYVSKKAGGNRVSKANTIT